MGKIVQHSKLVPALGLLVEGDEGVLGGAGEVLAAEEGEDNRRGKGDAIIQWSAGEKARDAAPGGCVGIYNVRLVAGFDVAGDAATVSGGGARGSCEAVGANAAAGVGDEVVGPAVSAGQGIFARGEVGGGGVGVLFGEDDEGDWDDDGGGDEKEENDAEKAEGPDGHAATSAGVRLGIATGGGIRRDGLVSAETGFGQWRRPP